MNKRPAVCSDQAWGLMLALDKIHPADFPRIAEVIDKVLDKPDEAEAGRTASADAARKAWEMMLKAEARAEKAEARADALAEALKDIQWSGNSGNRGSCPYCGEEKETGHYETCAVGKALAAHREGTSYKRPEFDCSDYSQNRPTRKEVGHVKTMIARKHGDNLQPATRADNECPSCMGSGKSDRNHACDHCRGAGYAPGYTPDRTVPLAMLIAAIDGEATSQNTQIEYLRGIARHYGYEVTE